MFNINNKELILKAKNGESDAIEKILDNFKAYIIRQAMNNTIKNYEIDDIIQECNISILHAIKLYDIEKNSFTSYILITIKNTFNAIFRKAIPQYENEVHSNFLEENTDLEENINNLLDKISFDEIIKNLNQREKTILIYFYVYNLKLNDIAKKLKISKDKCFKVKKNAIKKLKNKFRFRYDSNKYCFK